MNLYNSHYARCPHPSPSLLQGDKGQTVAQTVRIVNEKALLMSRDGVYLMFLSKAGWTWWSDSVGTNPHTAFFQTRSLVQFWVTFETESCTWNPPASASQVTEITMYLMRKGSRKPNNASTTPGSDNHFRQSQSHGLAHSWHFPASQRGLASWEVGT